MNMNNILRFTSNASFVAGGLVLVVTGVQSSFSRQLAQLVGQGTLVLPTNAVQPEATAMLVQGSLHASAPVQSNAETALCIGVLLVILGFGFNVWYSLRSPRRVPVHAV
jgi:hypothetical protein